MSASVADEAIGRILVGGTPDAISALRHLAPRPIAARMRAAIAADLEASAEEVRTLARSAIESLERQDEQRMVSDMIEKAGSGMASFGIEPVLKAINEQNVYVFAYVADLELSGAVCDNCAQLLSDRQVSTQSSTCPGCNGPTMEVPDLVDVMTSRVVNQGGRIEEVRGEAADWLTSRGGLGGVHRYAAKAEAEGSAPR
jgi:peptide subunit release factor 1 (eRF1)